jgi:hypothetical protein
MPHLRFNLLVFLRTLVYELIGAVVLNWVRLINRLHT